MTSPRSAAGTGKLEERCMKRRGAGPKKSKACLWVEVELVREWVPLALIFKLEFELEIKLSSGFGFTISPSKFVTMSGMFCS